MYCCQVCSTPSKPGQVAKKIVIFRKVNQNVRQTFVDKYGKPGFKMVERELLQIEKEMLACDLCHDGYRKGIPLANLAQMHKPKELTRPASVTTGPVSSPTGDSPDTLAGGANAPRDGASKPWPDWFPKALGEAQAADLAAKSSPPENRGPLAKRKSKAELLLEQQEQGGKRTPKAKHANPKKERGKGKQPPSKPEVVSK